MNIQEMFQTLPCRKCFYEFKDRTSYLPIAVVDAMLQMNGKPYDLLGLCGASLLDEDAIVWIIAFHYSSTNVEILDLFMHGRMKTTNVCNPLLTEDVLKAFPQLKDSVWKSYRRPNTPNGDAPVVIVTEFKVQGHNCDLKKWLDFANDIIPEKFI